MSRRTPGRRRSRTLLSCCTVLAAAGVAQPVAANASAAHASTSGHSGGYVVRDLRALSGATPFPPGCPGAGPDDAHIARGGVEPAGTGGPPPPRPHVARPPPA